LGQESENAAEAAHLRTTFLASVGTALLSSTLSFEETLTRVATMTVQAVADWCAIDLPYEGLESVVHANPEQLPWLQQLPRFHALRGLPRALSTAEPELYAHVNDQCLQDNARTIDNLELLHRLELRSMMIVPIQARGATMGTIVFGSSKPGRVYTSDDVDMAQRLAQKTAFALENARLFRRERQARALIEQAAERMSRLQSLTADLARALTSQAVAQVVIDHSAAGVGALTSGIWTLDAAGTELCLLQSAGYPPEAQRLYARLDLASASPAADAVRQRAPIFVSSRAELEQRYPAAADRAAQVDMPPVIALACLPLLVGEEAIGVLVFTLRDRSALAPDERVFLTVAAGHCAQSLHRARIFEAERRASAEKALLYDEVARLLEESKAARAEAEDASRMKDEFLAVVSHELRTPMSAILGWSHILKTERRNEPAMLTKGLDVIERNARAQTKIIEDILDVSRVITGKLVIEPVTVSLAAVVADAIDVVRPSAAAKEIALALDAPADDPFAIIGDPGRLRQIVWNLLSNAVKFTPRGGRVEVQLSREEGLTTLSVRDTGKGIPPSFLPHVFERFRQADSSTTRMQGGLGLGLAIVRHLVELHGGQVRAASDGLERGSTFTVMLPQRAPGMASSPGAKAERGTGNVRRPTPDLNNSVKLAGMKILVVDDETDAREMLNTALSGYGAAVQTVSTARAALKVIPLYEPRVLISDIGMPGEDGYVLIKQVRDLPGPHGRVPAIALTAYARPEDRMRALAAGYDEHVAKPAEPFALATLIAGLTGR